MPCEMGQILAANETITVDMPGPGRTLLTYAGISGIDCFHRFFSFLFFLCSDWRLDLTNTDQWSRDLRKMFIGGLNWETTDRM